MEIRLKEEYAGVSRLYREDIMGDQYEPPGPRFERDDNGRRTADLKDDVAQALIDDGVAEQIDTTDDGSTDQTPIEEVDPAVAPGEFVDYAWNTVTGAIDTGHADEALDAVREAENNREDGKRTSVIKALNEREDTLGEGDGEGA